MTDRSIQCLATSLKQVFETEDAEGKAKLCLQIWADFQAGLNQWHLPTEDWPLRPARPKTPLLKLPKDMPRRRLGGLNGRIAQLHALAHIELNAIDLAIDIIGRFYRPPLPNEFLRRWLGIAADEAKHFLMLARRLRELGSFYGALPAHDGLWQAAIDTADDLGARLSLVPLVLEARGLDVTPAMIERFERSNDPESARILHLIYSDEKAHVAAGIEWFSFYCRANDLDEAETFRNFVSTRFKGQLKPPFNKIARQEAGMPDEFYMEFE